MPVAIRSNTYIALFRGINVGGNNPLPMKSLVEIFQALGCENVQTYIQSGNAVFETTANRAETIGRELSDCILEKHGFKPKVLVIDDQHLARAIAANPFNTEDGKALHFFFLDSPPASPDLDKLDAVKSDTEQFALVDQLFYLYAPDRIGISKLATKVEQAMGVPVTARNWNTVNKLALMIGDF